MEYERGRVGVNGPLEGVEVDCHQSDMMYRAEYMYKWLTGT